ncbi:unnamed protein product, partial [Polarella glacialis]
AMPLRWRHQALLALGVCGLSASASASVAEVLREEAGLEASVAEVPAQRQLAEGDLGSQSMGAAADQAAVVTDATKTDDGAAEVEASSWLSRLGDTGIALIVIAISTGPAIALSIYRRMQQDESGEGFGGLLGATCRRADTASDSAEDSDGDGIN